MKTTRRKKIDIFNMRNTIFSFLLSPFYDCSMFFFARHSRLEYFLEFQLFHIVDHWNPVFIIKFEKEEMNVVKNIIRITYPKDNYTKLTIPRIVYYIENEIEIIRKFIFQNYLHQESVDLYYIFTKKELPID